MKKEAKPIVCKLTNPELQKRRSTVIASLKEQIQKRQERKNGYSYKFVGSDEMLDMINDFIKSERRCCDFFTFRVTVEEKNVRMDITGPAGAKEFLEAEVDL